MKWKWLAIAVSAALPAVAVAQQDGKQNEKPDGSAQVRDEQDRADDQVAKARTAVAEAQDYNRVLTKLREEKSIKGAWLGLSASQPPQALRRQLKLPDGTGLVVDFIQPESPAAKVGLKQYDLLIRLNDQLLINSEQLSVLVRTFKPGNKVHLEFLREGERQSVNPELAEHEVPPLVDQPEFGPMQNFRFQPKGFGGGASPSAEPENGRRGFGGGGGGQSSSGDVREEQHTYSLVDGKHQLSVEVSNGRRVLSVLDARSGRLMSKFPIDSDKQIAALPTDIREPLGRLLSMLADPTNHPDPKAAGAPDTFRDPPDGRPGADGPPAGR